MAANKKIPIFFFIKLLHTVYPEVPPKVEYALSDLGLSMEPIIQAMEEWGNDYKKSIDMA
ncbi:MAG: winged helix-turn-helix transcriptional regulator [Eubacteriaceae bacterium]